MVSNDERITPLLAGMDAVYFSCDLPVSDAMRERLTQEKALAQARAVQRQVHCPEWLEARIAPQGAKGGYAFLIETEDFSVKLLGEHIQNRPSVFIEMRSYALHTHPVGAAGACESALAWVRSHLYADQFTAAKEAISFTAAKISRADIHMDWQGGYAPARSHLSEELRCFIRPGRVKGALYFQGGAATGIQFGRSQVVARLYNKTLETKEKGNEADAELLSARCGETFNPELDVWRLEFERKREGAQGFRLYSPPEEEDPDEEVEAEMSAEELQHIGTLPRVSLLGWRSSSSISRATGCASCRTVRMPTARAGRCIRPGSSSAKHSETSPLCLPSMMRSAHSYVAHDTVDVCAC
jgi:hypothetical protein